MNLRKIKAILRKPSKHGATGKIWLLRVLARIIGKKDCQENQVRACEDGYTTPNVAATGSSLAKYENDTYCKVTKALEPLTTETNKKITELDLLKSQKDSEITDKGEKGARQKRYQEIEKKKREAKIKELNLYLSEARSLIESVDEWLTHFLEASEDAAKVYVNSYWRGVLMAAEGKDIGFTAKIPEAKEYEGRKLYIQRRDELLQSIKDVLTRGGEGYAEES